MGRRFVKRITWFGVFVLTCAAASVVAQAAPRIERKTVQSVHAAPPGGYKELQAGTMVDRDDLLHRYKIDLVTTDRNNPNGNSRMDQVDVDEKVTVIPPGDGAFVCTHCIGKVQAESMVVQLRVAGQCSGDSVMKAITTTHSDKTVHVNCDTVLPPPPPPQ